MNTYSCRFRWKCPYCEEVNDGIDAAVKSESTKQAEEDIFDRVHICGKCNIRLLDKTDLFIIDCKLVSGR